MSERVGIFVAAVYFLLSSLTALHSVHEETPVARRQGILAPSSLQLAVGFVTNLLDILSIGSLATTTAMFRLGSIVPDEMVPGTMNVGHILPTILQAFLYIAIVRIDLRTLLFCLHAAAVGAGWRAGFVAKLPICTVQLGIGSALVASVVFRAIGQLHWFPLGGEKLALHGFRLVAGTVRACLFGGLSTLGIGFYAPFIILVSLVGMKPLAASPIMMGSSAFLMPVASPRFPRNQAYDSNAAMGLAVGGLPAVLLTAFIVKSLPLQDLRWLLMTVALWAALVLFRSASHDRNVQVIPSGIIAT